jgi:hypothetical protein
LAARRFPSPFCLFPFPSSHELCESHPSEIEYAQHYKDQEAIRRHRQIFWQLHSQIVRSGASGRIDPDHKLMPARRFPPPGIR